MTLGPAASGLQKIAALRLLHGAARRALPASSRARALSCGAAPPSAALDTAGKTPAFVDGQIAAIARVNALILVTANVSDYEGFEGLTIEDWRKR